MSAQRGQKRRGVDGIRPAILFPMRGCSSAPFLSQRSPPRVRAAARWSWARYPKGASPRPADPEALERLRRGIGFGMDSARSFGSGAARSAADPRTQGPPPRGTLKGPVRLRRTGGAFGAPKGPLLGGGRLRRPDFVERRRTGGTFRRPACAHSLLLRLVCRRRRHCLSFRNPSLQPARVATNPRLFAGITSWPR